VFCVIDVVFLRVAPFCYGIIHRRFLGVSLVLISVRFGQSWREFGVEWFCGGVVDWIIVFMLCLWAKIFYNLLNIYCINHQY
jgi:hypothetical protein